MSNLNHLTLRRLFPAAGVLILAGACLLGLASTAQAQNGIKKKINSADKVKVTATATQPDGTGQQVITLKLAIEKGWHLYANPVNHENYESNRTIVTAKANGKAVPIKVMYPKGELRKDDKDTYNVYEGMATIQVVVNRAALAGPVMVDIQVNACNENTCFPTGHILVQVQ